MFLKAADIDFRKIVIIKLIIPNHSIDKLPFQNLACNIISGFGINTTNQRTTCIGLTCIALLYDH